MAGGEVSAKHYGRGDALVDALVAYKARLIEGRVRGLVLRSARDDFESWEIQWEALAQTPMGPNPVWVQVKIVQRDLYVLGIYALRTLQKGAIDG
jgi:hypothetical protein